MQPGANEAARAAAAAAARTARRRARGPVSALVEELRRAGTEYEPRSKLVVVMNNLVSSMRVLSCSYVVGMRWRC